MKNQVGYLILILGFFVGIALIMTVLIVAASGSREITIETNKKIIPEWKLTTDGKRIDTLYIYKKK
ncbi:MAG TPA: hypothetical protein VLA48_03490 [Nitrososphaeraceae archaeon]|nr:hypothetical protein [Nitrososphaeraceae archaeon]